MDYEKKYKEALEKARQFSEHPLEENSSSIVEYIFPELQESEDEKIREMLIRIYKKADMGGEIFGEGITYKQVIAWLEKQGTSYTKRGVDDAFVEGMAFAKDELEKQGEQKPIEWNERDESVLTEIINDVKFTQSKNPNSYMNQLLFKKEIDWLKSLKQRMGG